MLLLSAVCLGASRSSPAGGSSPQLQLHLRIPDQRARLGPVSSVRSDRSAAIIWKRPEVCTGGEEEKDSIATNRFHGIIVMEGC